MAYKLLNMPKDINLYNQEAEWTPQNNANKVDFSLETIEARRKNNSIFRP